MNIPLALLNLLHQKVRTAVAVGGVTFAIVLLFMQLAFLNSAERSATVFFENLHFDLILTGPAYMEATRAGGFPRSRVYQALAVPGVKRAAPLYVESNLWRIQRKKTADGGPEPAPDKPRRPGLLRRRRSPTQQAGGDRGAEGAG
jgi:putative ABC transport system permease protein